MLVRSLVLLGVLITGVSSASAAPKRFQWLRAAHAPAVIHLPDGDCLDLRGLPAGWRVSSATTDASAQFGIPGIVTAWLSPRFSVLVNIGDEARLGLFDYRAYGETWAKPVGSKPSSHLPEEDVVGFQASPADDGEIIYVSDSLDAFMECGEQIACTIHDRVEPELVRFNVMIPWNDRSNAADRLAMARRTIQRIRTRCVPVSER